jgi:hypothetical protein
MPASTPPSASSHKGEAWQILKGPSLGTGTAPLSALRKSLKVTLPGAGKFAAEGFATRETADGPTVSVIIRLTNMDRVEHCAVDSDSDKTVWADSAGAPIAVRPTYSGLFGVRDVCIQPSDSGYLSFVSDAAVGSSMMLFDQLAGLDLTLTEMSRADAEKAAKENGRGTATLAAKEYGVTSDHKFSITYANTAAAPVSVNRSYGGLTFIMLDESNQPLGTSEFDSDEATVPVGGTVTMTGRDNFDYYEGQSQRVLAFDIWSFK